MYKEKSTQILSVWLDGLSESEHTCVTTSQSKKQNIMSNSKTPFLPPTKHFAFFSSPEETTVHISISIHQFCLFLNYIEMKLYSIQSFLSRFHHSTLWLWDILMLLHIAVICSFFTAVQYSIVWIYHNLCILLLMDSWIFSNFGFSE